MVEAARSSETLVLMYYIMQQHTSDDTIFIVTFVKIWNPMSGIKLVGRKISYVDGK